MNYQGTAEADGRERAQLLSAYWKTWGLRSSPEPTQKAGCGGI